MHHLDLRAEMARRNLHVCKIARDLGVSHATVSLVIDGKATSRRVAEHIAGLVGMPYGRVFPITNAR